jgi:hypothetical protein
MVKPMHEVCTRALAQSARLASLLCLGACNAILGIEAAELDPDLRDAGADRPDAGSSPDAVVSPDAEPTPVTCVGYCELVLGACRGTQLQYLDYAVCEALCGDMALGRAGDTEGDTVGCRMSHAKLALTNAAAECENAGPLGGQACGGAPCTTFCRLNEKRCQTIAYSSQGACQADCATYEYRPAEGVSLSSGNTLNCRMNRLQQGIMSETLGVECVATGRQSASCQ